MDNVFVNQVITKNNEKSFVNQFNMTRVTDTIVVNHLTMKSHDQNPANH